jgi:enterochelin esterase-like enzyme
MNGIMLKEPRKKVQVETHVIRSVYLERDVTVDFYLPRQVADPSGMSLLLINDGQNLEELGLAPMLQQLLGEHAIRPLLCVGIHADANRKLEYGTAHRADFMGRGNRAALYRNFIVQELLPFTHQTFHIQEFRDAGFAGFSLGGLSALDLVWNQPHLFQKVGVFSGALWWRTKALDEGYIEDRDRIMHTQVQQGSFKGGLKFFFETGTQDETADRNQNGIIDSIDDTLSLVDLLCQKGYDRKRDIQYLELADGKHDVATWARAMPAFLKWGWGTMQLLSSHEGYSDLAK